MARAQLPVREQLDMQLEHIVNLLDPINPQDAATRAFVLANAGTGGGGISATQTISTDTTAERNMLYVITADLTLTLPASPADGDCLFVVNRSNTTTVELGRNGQNIFGLAENFVLDVEDVNFKIVYTSGSQGWVTISQPVGGGGSGGGRGFQVDGVTVAGSAAVDFVTDSNPSSGERAVDFQSDADNQISAVVDVSGLGGGAGYGVTTLGTSSSNIPSVNMVLVVPELSSAVTYTLPSESALTVGDWIRIANLSTRTDLTFARNGVLIAGQNTDLVINRAGFSFEMIYSGTTLGWVII
ncbi:MAG: hypothetical protein MPJ25_10535 [Pirellulales bacterium]|nr:hypothetical protein [Pirellulales bacterium]